NPTSTTQTPPPPTPRLKPPPTPPPPSPAPALGEIAGPNQDPPLLVAIDDAPARQIVRRKLDGDLVSRQNANKILAHLAGNVRQNLVLVLQLDAEHGVGQRLDDRGHHFNGVLLRISRVAFVALLFVLEPLRHILLLLTRAGLKPGL